MNKRFNTKKSGIARTILFKSGKTYKAVCLDFDIIEECKTKEEVETRIKEAIVGYVENVCKNKLDDKLLNRHADKKYWDMYYKHLEIISKKDESKKVVEVQQRNTSTSMFTMPFNINSRMLCAV